MHRACKSCAPFRPKPPPHRPPEPWCTRANPSLFPAAVAVFRFVFFFSLWGVCFLSIMASLLLRDTPFIRVSSEYDRPTLGWVVLEAAAMYLALMVLSGWAW